MAAINKPAMAASGDSLRESLTAAAPPAARYGIHINVFGQEALRLSLPHERWARFRSIARPTGAQARFYDEALEPLAVQHGEHAKNGHILPESRLSISRVELMDLLDSGLGEVVRRGKQFQRYDAPEGGEVEMRWIHPGSNGGPSGQFCGLRKLFPLSKPSSFRPGDSLQQSRRET